MKRLLRVLAIVVAVLILAAVALPFLIDANTFKPTLETRLTAALGREIHLGDLKLSVFSGSFTADDLSIADDPAFGKAPFLRAKSLSVGVDLIPLIASKKLNVTGLTIDQPEVNLLQSPQGEWNFATLGGPAHPEAQAKAVAAAPAADKPMDFSVKLIRITNGRFTLGSTRPKSQPQQLEKINIELNDFSVGAPFTFSLAASVVAGGDIKLKGKAGPIPADVSTLPFDASLTINGLDVAHTGFAPPSTGIAGLISIDGKAASNGSVVTVSGKLKADNLKLVQAGSPAKRQVEVDIAFSHDMRKRGGTLESSAVRIGKAEAHISGTYDLTAGGAASQMGIPFRIEGTSDTPTFKADVKAIKMKVDGPKMPLTELTAILPAIDVVLPNGSSIDGGTATADLTADGPLDHLTTTGSLSIDQTRLANFDLGSNMKLLEKFTDVPSSVNTEIETLRASVTNGIEGTELRDINVIVTSIGALTGAGTVSAKHELAFKMSAALHAVVGEMVKDPAKAVDAAKGLIHLFK